MANSSDLRLDIAPDIVAGPVQSKKVLFWQIIRFSIVGICNASIDILTLNLLLFSFPTHNPDLLLLYNTAAYTLGAINSYLFNKYWTFRHKQATTQSELLRFAMLNGVGILCNDLIIWVAAKLLHPHIANATLWANAAKLCAIIGTAVVSYLGMRLWVFAGTAKGRGRGQNSFSSTALAMGSLSARADENSSGSEQAEGNKSGLRTKRSLSVILPAYNEEQAIAESINNVVATLTPWVRDFEVIVVNDGSKDNTQAVVEHIAANQPRIRLINHQVNQGYGAALVSGFQAVNGELAFFTDSDGQFDIRDLDPFFPLIEHYDAVLGYRINRQDTWMRKLNAWGWKMLVNTLLGLGVRDVDCAFKLYRADFFRSHCLETRGAMINAEILYKLKRSGLTYTQIGVHHLPRRSGRATGAKLSVILRALRELFFYAWKWRSEERRKSGRV